VKRFLTIIGPGLLVAATGIGAGDLATASFAGSFLGTAVLWAVVIGALMKFSVTEGLARWQLATGTTLLEGVVGRLGPAFGWVFLAYLVFWSFFVGSALMSACGVALHALLPVFDDARSGKIVFGALCSLLGWALVLIGGYPLFEKIMKVCIGFMFLTVISTAALLWPGSEAVLTGLLLPSIPQTDGALGWTVALMGGVGGTVTVLCYGYWIREENRSGPDALNTSRIDLAAAYLVTAVFGVAMVIIGGTIEIEGRGASLLVDLSARLGESLGPFGRLAFLVGAAGAVFSSLLGVWQAVPYLFADTWQQLRGSGRSGNAAPGDPTAYRLYLAALALLPMAGLFLGFQAVQKLYAVVGAWFFPALTLALLVMNNRRAWIGERYRNGITANLALLVILVFFSWIALRSF
jgi:Mn2+/Fe2+ NRAMP family transporter